MNTQATCKPSSGAIQLHKADYQEQTDAGSEIQVAVTQGFSTSQLPVSGLDTTIREREEKLEKNGQSYNRESQPQSLPPAEKNAKDVAKGNMNQNIYAGIVIAKEFDRILLNIKSQKSENSCPSRPNSLEEVCSKQNDPEPFVTGHSRISRMNSSMAVVCHPQESGSPAENDELKLIIL